MRHSEIALRRHNLALRSRQTPVVRAALAAANGLGLRGGPLLQLLLLSKLQGFLRHIVLTLMDREFPDGDLSARPDTDPRILDDFLRLALELGVAARVDGAVVPEPAYTTGFPGFGGDSATRPRAEAEKDYVFVRGLIRKAEADGESGPLHRPDVRYLIVLSRYILELEGMRFDAQVAPSFSEKFYSDLGALAYELYTKRSFERLCRRLSPASVLDIGCGDGLHMSSVLSTLPTARMVGLEPQVKVADATRERLSGHPNTRVESVRFTDHDTTDRFDMVLSSFMIFYMPEEERVPFFRRVREVLSPTGTYVIGQYFPDFEDVQEVLVRSTSPVPGIQLYLSGVGNSLVKAEALLNRVLSDFRSVAYWSTLQDQLSEAGLAVEEIVPADSMYYSYFLLVRRAEGAS
ncbi:MULTISPECIES: cyclopropane-fatty-acyl-phospholipid synthase family protein [Nocardiopsis]|uniref:SAM-dependent methyltransferase n=1 Tax=Nocardiopsis TaxID=2013 RepID=UPI0003801B3B|nr:class I SAM-dependent methyltransferase [Nocardiopsis sp. CNS-639]